MRIFKTVWFNRFARKNEIRNEHLITLVNELEAGIFDADLGGGIYKKRLARQGQGKSRGFRTLICFRNCDRAFFMYGFPKSANDNISQSELANLKKLAKIILDMDWKAIEKGLAGGKFFEIGVGDEDI